MPSPAEKSPKFERGQMLSLIPDSDLYASDGKSGLLVIAPRCFDRKIGRVSESAKQSWQSRAYLEARRA